MDARSAAELLRFLEQNDFEIYVDGGWAVDALLGEQTRPHDDLDIAMPHGQVPRLREVIGKRGFREHPRDDSWECNFVLSDEQDHRLDVHSYTLDASGNNVYGVPYAAEHLTGKGVIDGHPVRSIAPHWLVRFHCGYEPDENDHHDVRLLCERFGIAVPELYLRRFADIDKGPGTV